MVTFNRRIYYIIFSIVFLYLLVFFYLLPFVADDWIYSHDWSVLNMLQFGGDNSPGRHTSKLLTQICTLFLAPILGVFSPMVGLKLAYAIMSTILTLSLWFVSNLYIYTCKENYLKIIILSLLSFSLSMHYTAPVFTIQIIGGFVVTLSAWLPFLYYLNNKHFPTLFTKNSFGLGLFFVITYLGCNVTDLSYWITCSLSFAFIVYIWVYRNTYTKERTLATTLALAQISMGVLSFFRNIIGTGQLAFRQRGISFTFTDIYARVFAGAFWQDITIVIGGLIFLYFIYRFIVKKEFPFHAFFIGIGYFYIGITAVIGTYQDQALWILWLGELCVLFNLYERKVGIIQFLIPTLIFGLFISSMKEMRTGKLPLLYSQSENHLVEMFQFTQRNDKQPSLLLTNK